MQGDCLEEMKKMNDNSVDIVFTSVPFKNKDIGAKTDDEYWKTYSKWHSEMLRVSSKAVFVIQSASKLNGQILHFPPKRTMIWGKGVIMNHSRYNPIFVYQKSDDYKVNKYIWSDTFGVEPVSGHNFKRCGTEKIHKYQDPVLLYETILKMFKNISAVIDPFMGSGTTGEACLNLGIDFIGIELDQGNFNLAKQRIEGIK